MAGRSSRRDAFLCNSSTATGSIESEFSDMPSLIRKDTGTASASSQPQAEGNQAGIAKQKVGPGGDNGEPMLKADSRGYYKLRIQCQDDNTSVEDVGRLFKNFGELKEAYMAAGFVFVSFDNKEVALRAYNATKNDCHVSPVMPTKRVFATSNSGPAWSAHSQTGQDIYISNLSPEVTPEDLETLLNDYSPMRIRLLQRGQSNAYGFAKFSNVDQAKIALEGLKSKQLYGKHPLVRMVRDRSKARIIEEGASRGYQGNSDKSTTVHVGNIPNNATEEDVRTLFIEYGGVSKFFMNVTKYGNRMYARATLRSEALVKEAVKNLNNTTLLGESITVTVFGFPATIRPLTRPTASPRVVDVHHSKHGHTHHHSANGQNKAEMVKTAYQLAQKVNILSSEVLDSCDICQRLQTLIKDLEHTLGHVVSEESRSFFRTRVNSDMTRLE